MSLTLLPRPARRYRQPEEQRLRCLCGSLCTRHAGLHLSERGKAETWGAQEEPRHWGLHLLGPRRPRFHSPLPPLKHQQPDICHLLIRNLSLILAVSCLFWEWSTPTMNIFSSEIPKRNVSIKKEMFLNHYESSQPINHQVHCAWSGIFRNYNSNNIPSGLQIDIYLLLSHKNITTSWSKLFEQNLLRIDFALTLNLIGKLSSCLLPL